MLDKSDLGGVCMSVLYVCMSIRRACVYLCVSACVRMHLCMHVSVYASVRVYLYVHVCECVCVRVCICVSIMCYYHHITYRQELGCTLAPGNTPASLAYQQVHSYTVTPNCMVLQ